jgi:UPF0176 protein
LISETISETMAWTVVTFYKFVALPDCAELRSRLINFCQTVPVQAAVKGTVLLAEEGMNGTLAGELETIEAVLNFLRTDPRFVDISCQWAEAEQMPFERLKVKLKPEIVHLGLPAVNPAQQVGTYVEPQDWNTLIADPDVTVIDTRNQYEVDIGSFAGAINPQTKSFQEFPEFVQAQLDPKQHKKIAMFCTGGIRCEKASAYLLSQGFEQVYHLRGGILHYLAKTPAEHSTWRGECFVFDERVAVQHGLAPGTHRLCPTCGQPVAIATTECRTCTPTS